MMTSVVAVILAVVSNQRRVGSGGLGRRGPFAPGFELAVGGGYGGYGGRERNGVDVQGGPGSGGAGVGGDSRHGRRRSRCGSGDHGGERGGVNVPAHQTNFAQLWDASFFLDDQHLPFKDFPAARLVNKFGANIEHTPATEIRNRVSSVWSVLPSLSSWNRS
ncbi:hypothetical protein BC828DRAFT_20568 [Blastocladiella britannica]|nr:hypothetical protein BC828DRAFT_20568 [Blastocladiella britannica]